jgi:hypothetical protein
MSLLSDLRKQNTGASRAKEDIPHQVSPPDW